MIYLCIYNLWDISWIHNWVVGEGSIYLVALATAMHFLFPCHVLNSEHLCILINSGMEKSMKMEGFFQSGGMSLQKVVLLFGSALALSQWWGLWRWTFCIMCPDMLPPLFLVDLHNGDAKGCHMSGKLTSSVQQCWWMPPEDCNYPSFQSPIIHESH